MLKDDAPKTFLIPISCVRCAVIKAVKPNKPIHAINIARIENANIVFPNLLSNLYIPQLLLEKTIKMPNKKIDIPIGVIFIFI